MVQRLVQQLMMVGCLLGGMGPAWADVGYDAAALGTPVTENTTASHNHTTSASATVMTLGVIITTSSGTAGTVTALSYNAVDVLANGVLLSTSTSGSNQFRQYLYCLDNPSSGTNSASVTISGLTAGSDALSLHTVTYTGSGACASFTNTATASGSSTTPTVTVNGVASTSIVQDIFCTNDVSATVGTGQTDRGQYAITPNGCGSVGASTQLGSTETNAVMSWTTSNTTWHTTAAEIAIPSTGGAPTLGLLGVGH